MIKDFLILHKEELFTIGTKILIAVLIVIGCRIIYGIVKRITGHMSRSKLSVDNTILSLVKVVTKYALIIVCIIMILGVFNVNTTGLVALLGAAGVAIGLALKDTLGNIAAGIVLILLHSYRQGDYIEFGSYSGTVKDFDLFTTRLETPDGIFISAPNSTIWSGPLKNYSKNNVRRMEFVIGISYGDSIEIAFNALQKLINLEARFLKDPAPQIIVQSLGDSSVNIALRAWAKSDVYWDVYWFQMRNIKEKIEAAGLSIPFPQRDVHLITEKA